MASTDYAWKDIYPELVNKVRWAICTSVKTPESNYPYTAAQRVATVLAQDIVELLRLAVDEPGVVGSIATVRNALLQERVVDIT